MMILEPEEAAARCLRDHRGKAVPLTQVVAELAGMSVSVEGTWAALQEMIAPTPEQGPEAATAFLLVDDTAAMVSVAHDRLEDQDTTIQSGRRHLLAGALARTREQLVEAGVTDPKELDAKLSGEGMSALARVALEQGEPRLLTVQQLGDVREHAVVQARLGVDGFFRKVYETAHVTGPPFSDYEDRKVALVRDAEMQRTGIALTRRVTQGASLSR
jgi:hypothetical protein